MTDALPAASWAGWFHDAVGEPAFILVEPGDGGGLLITVPAHGWFRRPEAASAPGVSGVRLDFTLGDVHVRLSGAAGPGHAAGTAVAGDHAGEFELWTARPLDEVSYRRFVSHFEGGGRAISLHIQSDTFFGEQMAMYVEGDQVVRMHPVAHSAAGLVLVSERAELLELRDCQAGAMAAVVISRPGTADPVRNLRAAPMWDEEDVAFRGPAGHLAGTVMTPRADAVGAAVALVHGAGGGRRDFYRLFGEQFVRAGIRALIYDKRGHGQSEGGESTLLDRSRDAEAAVDFLQAAYGIVAGLYGFSNGAWSVPMVSARRDDLGFSVVMGAPGVTMARSEVHRRVSELREQGIGEGDCDLVATMWTIIYRYLESGSGRPSDREMYDRSAQLLADGGSLGRVQLQQYAIDDPTLSPIPPYRTYAELTAGPRAGADADARYDPVPDYRRTRCPVLFIVGELDQNLPAAESAARVSRALQGAAHGRSLVRIFPRAGHMMNLVDAGGLHGISSEEASYRFHRFQFAPGFLTLLRQWSRQQAEASTGR